MVILIYICLSKFVYLNLQNWMWVTSNTYSHWFGFRSKGSVQNCFCLFKRISVKWVWHIIPIDDVILQLHLCMDMNHTKHNRVYKLVYSIHAKLCWTQLDCILLQKCSYITITIIFYTSTDTSFTQWNKHITQAWLNDRSNGCTVQQ